MLDQRSFKPYLIRAISQWITDNNETPHLVVLTDYPNVCIPSQLKAEPTVVFNIGEAAVRLLVIGTNSVAFRARFQGSDQLVEFDIGAVVGVFSKETKQGITFNPPAIQPAPEPETKELTRPKFSVVKGDKQ